MYSFEEKKKSEKSRQEKLKHNFTGIPDSTKNHLEYNTGLSFDDVRVHYNSDRPTKLQALAYTQGNQIYMGPGQETHLNHELGHVVQQKLGIVRPTKYLNGVPVNDDLGMEKQADDILQHTEAKSRDQAIGYSEMPVQFWNFKAHLDSLNAAINIAQPEVNAAGIFDIRKLGNVIRAGNLGNDLGENTTTSDGNPGKDDMIGFGVKYIIPMALTADSAFIKSSHKGDMQYLHGMKGKEEDTAKQLEDYVKFAYRVAKDPEDTHLTRMRLEELEGENYYGVGTTRIFPDLKAVFGKDATLKKVAQLSKSAEADAVRAYFLGSATHVIQDSFCSSHTLRENHRTAKGGGDYNPIEDIKRIKDGGDDAQELMVMAGVTDIISTRNYIGQDSNKHEIADRMVGGNIDITPGLRQATNVVALVLASMNDEEIKGESLDAFFEKLFVQKEVGDKILPPGGRAYRKEEDYRLEEVFGPKRERIKKYLAVINQDELNDASFSKKTLGLGPRRPDWRDTRNAPQIIAVECRKKQLLNQQKILLDLVPGIHIEPELTATVMLRQDLAEVELELKALDRLELLQEIPLDMSSLSASQVAVIVESEYGAIE